MSSRRNGQAMAELCAGLLVVIPLTLALMDSMFVFIGAALNDSICRDAARAAASGPPSSVDPKSTPAQRAATVIKYVYYSGLPMKVRDTVDVSETVTDVPPASQGGGVSGDVTITTTIDIYPPFLISYIANGKVVLKSQHTVPFTYVVPAS